MLAAHQVHLSKCCEMLRFAPRLVLPAFSDVFWNQSFLVPRQLAVPFPVKTTANNSNPLELEAMIFLARRLKSS
jgi:hypothetical protein